MSNKSSRILYGILAFAPLAIGIFWFFFSFIGMFGMMSMTMAAPRSGHGIMAGFMGFQFLLMLLGFLAFALGTVLFVRHALTNPTLEQEIRIVWVVMFFVFAGMAPIVYYFMYFFSDVKIPDIAANTSSSNRQDPPQQLPPGSQII